jgi:hypothetical protein
MPWLTAAGVRRVAAALGFGLVVALELLGLLPVDLSGVLRDLLKPFVLSWSSPPLTP